MRVTARLCVFSSVFAWRLWLRASYIQRGALAQVSEWLLSVHENPVSGSKTDVILNLKMMLFDNGKRRYFKLKDVTIFGNDVAITL